MKLAKFSSAAVLLFWLVGCRTFFHFGIWRSPYYHLEKAEQALRAERFDDAISAYKKHIDYRLASKERRSWENPYFYYLLIGDVYMGQNEIAKALAAYKFAEEQKVASELICDRIRMVARVYEEKGDLRTAIALLQEYRDKEPILIDDILDRLSKELIKQEDLEKSKVAGPPQ